MMRRPGPGSDHIAPTAPLSLTANLATNVGYNGLELRWGSGRDDNWISFYEVFRDGTRIARVAKGEYYFDRSPAASLTARYE